MIDTFGSVTGNKKGEETFSFSPLSYDFYGLHVTYVYPYSQTEEIPYNPRKWDQEYETDYAALNKTFFSTCLVLFIKVLF